MNPQNLTATFLVAFIMTGAVKAQPSDSLVQFFDHFEEAEIVMEADQKQMLEYILQRPTTKSARIVKAVDVQRLPEVNFLGLNISRDQRFDTVRDSVESKSEETHVWYGTITEDRGKVIMVIHKDNITGTFRIGKEMYKVEPVGSGYHVIIQIDPTKFPPEHPPEYGMGAMRVRPEDVPFRELVPVEPVGVVFPLYPMIDLLVAYTPAAASAHGDIIGLIQTAVSETNQSYSNSDVHLRVRLVHTVEVDYTESGSFFTDLDRFEDPSDDFMDEIHCLRKLFGADIAVLIIDDDTYCGLAADILATESSAFCVVHYDCATGYYSFAHEIGHLQGALHDMRVEPALTPFPYGHGFVDTSFGGWRTIMAYNDPIHCPDAYCVRLQNWSNPDVYHFGVAKGSETREDNARVLDETASTVAGFRTKPSGCKRFWIALWCWLTQLL